MEEILASIRRIIAEDGDAAPPEAAAAATAAPAKPAPVEEASDEILELTEVVEDDGSVTRFGSKPAIPEPPPPPAFEIDERFEPEPEPPPRADDVARLVSNATAAASVAALSPLVARGQRDELPLGGIGMGRTLEDMVRELIRPMLKTWLDDNLPHIVERLVREEIARLVREAQGH